MNNSKSDALVFYGATGDLAYKKIFPALQAMIKRGHLDVPVIGVAKAGWNLDQLRARARESLEKHGGIDKQAADKLSGLLRYVDGDYQNPATFVAIRKELGSDKVFDVVGRLFEGVSIKQYMQNALTESGADSSIKAIEGTLSADERKRLMEIADKCPVHRTLTSEIEIRTFEKPA